MTSLTIPKNVTHIGDGSFDYCTGLRTIYYNATSVTRNDDAMSAFIMAGTSYSAGTTLTIGTNVTRIPENLFAMGGSDESINIVKVVFTSGSTCTVIGEGAFCGLDVLTSITLPSGLKTIGADAFYGCYSLQSITIPKTVTSIGEEAFSICLKLATVYYTGTQAQWNAIVIGDYNDYLLNATKRYNS